MEVIGKDVSSGLVFMHVSSGAMTFKFVKDTIRSLIFFRSRAPLFQDLYVMSHLWLPPLASLAALGANALSGHELG